MAVLEVLGILVSTDTENGDNNGVFISSRIYVYTGINAARRVCHTRSYWVISRQRDHIGVACVALVLM